MLTEELVETKSHGSGGLSHMVEESEHAAKESGGLNYMKCVIETTYCIVVSGQNDCRRGR